MTAAGQSFSIRLQVVLYRTALAQVWRLLHACTATVQAAVEAGSAQRVVLAFGDSSAAPVLSDAAVVDLASEWRRGVDGELTYTFFGENLGSAGGSNRLAAEGNDERILVLNPDTYPSPPLLATLLDALKDPTVGIAEPRQVPLEHPKDFDVTSGDTSWASGCCLMIRRDTFDAIGGFDAEHFLLHCDDVDLSWRVRLLGQRVVHVPRAIVFHDKRIGRSGGVMPTDTELYYGVLGRMMLAHKYGRPDIAAETINLVEQHGAEPQRNALDEYRRRKFDARLPERVEGAERVAQFFAGEYARHRF